MAQRTGNTPAAGVRKIDVAKMYGVSPAAITSRLKNGTLRERPDGTIDPAEAERSFRESPSTKPVQTFGGDSPDMVSAKAKEAHYRAELRRLEYEERSGKLIDADKAKATYFAKARARRDLVLAVAADICDELAHMTDAHQVRERLTDALSAALEGPSDG